MGERGQELVLAAVGLAQRLLGGGALGDVDDELDALGVAEPRRGHQAPPAGAVRAHVLALVGRAAPELRKFREPALQAGQRLGGGDVGHPQLMRREVDAGVPRHLEEGVVGVGDHPVVTEERDADGVDRQRAAQPLLGPPQPLRALLALGDVDEGEHHALDAVLGGAVRAGRASGASGRRVVATSRSTRSR